MQTRSGRRLTGPAPAEAPAPAPAAAPLTLTSPILPTGPPPPAVDVPVPATADLAPLDADPVVVLAAAAGDAASGDWVTAARALTVLRAGCVHHAPAALAMIPTALPAVAAACASLRSALARHGLAAAADVATTFGGEQPWIVVGKEADATPSLLPALLARAAATGNKFIVDDAARALTAASVAVPPAVIIPQLAAAARAPNPRAAAAALAALADVVESKRQTLTDDVVEVARATAAGLASAALPATRAAAKRVAAALGGDAENAPAPANGKPARVTDAAAARAAARAAFAARQAEAR